LAGPEHRAPAHQFRREGPAEDLAGTGRLLEPGGHVDGVPDHRAVARPAHGGRHHLAGVDADREDQVPTELAHGQTGGDRSLGVVVVSDRNPEDGHQAVAHVFVDGAPVIGHDRP
jgi:hypothetical protein